MVLQQPDYKKRACRRPSSSIKNAARGRINKAPLTPHYALLYIDPQGFLKIRSSTSIQERISFVFSDEVRQNFLKTVHDGDGDHQPVAGRETCPPNKLVSVSDPYSTDGSDTQTSDHKIFPSRDDSTVSLRIGDTKSITKYYGTALRHFMQLNCCVMAKAFIKLIEPRKKAKHPYNGGRTGDSEETKPAWWPPHVTHREPDHLRKEDRIDLLIHIIRDFGRKGITADKLKEVAIDTKRSLRNPFHMDIMFEILRVRKTEEDFQYGEVDGDTLCPVPKCWLGSKSDEYEEFDDNADSPIVTYGATRHIEEDVSIPSSFNVQQIVAPATTAQTMGIPVNSLSDSFTLSEPLALQSRQNQLFYGIQSPFQAWTPNQQTELSNSINIWSAPSFHHSSNFSAPSSLLPMLQTFDTPIHGV